MVFSSSYLNHGSFSNPMKRLLPGLLSHLPFLLGEQPVSPVLTPVWRALVRWSGVFASPSLPAAALGRQAQWTRSAKAEPLQAVFRRQPFHPDQPGPPAAGLLSAPRRVTAWIQALFPARSGGLLSVPVEVRSGRQELLQVFRWQGVYRSDLEAYRTTI